MKRRAVNISIWIIAVATALLFSGKCSLWNEATSYKRTGLIQPSPTHTVNQLPSTYPPVTLNTSSVEKSTTPVPPTSSPAMWSKAWSKATNIATWKPLTITPTGLAFTPILDLLTPQIVGYSVQGRSLEVYKLGNGSIARMLIGGIHGGYEANTTGLVYLFLDHLRSHPELLPQQVTLYLMPVLNPDGLAAGTDRVKGRLNANKVDLNRNWDYQWQPIASHGPWPVSAGSAPFSEPETRALRDFILRCDIQAGIFYHSAMSEVYPGAGHDKSKTVELAKLMAELTGYRYAPEGIPGQITTGDAIDWLTSQGITAVEIDLSSHSELDWGTNLSALLAFLNWDLASIQPQSK